MESFKVLARGAVYSLITVWSINKTFLLKSIFISVALGLIPFISVWLMQELVNEVITVIQEGKSYEKAILYLICQMTIIILAFILQLLSQLSVQKLENIAGLVLKKAVLTKITKLPLLTFEDPAFYDKNLRVINSHSYIVSMVKDLFSLGSYIITVLSLVIYLANIHWFLILIVFIFSIPILLIDINFGNKRYNLTQFLTPHHRRELYITDLLNQRDSVKEVRLFGLGFYLIEQWSFYFKLNAQEKYKLLLKQSKWEVMGSILMTLTYIASGIFIVGLVSKKKLEVGVFLGALQSIQNIQSNLMEIIKIISSLYETSLFIREFELFQHQEEVESSFPRAHCNAIYTISLKNLSFTYPNQQQLSLKNINLCIEKGKKVVIVGENGSGKTTLIKCIAGLYKTSEQMIYVNDVPLEVVDTASYQKRISVLFQDFVQYEFSVKDNIGFGDIERLDNHSEITNAAQSTGIHDHILTLPEQYNSLLGRFFDGGNELSGGQWQKVAIARAIFKNSDVIILDEPTSALDSQSELEIIEHLFRDSEKSVLIITHRLGAAFLADHVIVMKHGEIVEEGSHAELLKLKGEYSRLYLAQTKMYESKKEVVV
ncbi:ATP-binding cassette, subfamily B [Fontibacillus panacisegetis]|uniref:ATP-binding cassette, subfamily B n=1 Tax=Fontibacillus panacisegetis TaxID=670482 RepID=A0A1G7NBW6_9BACL|nr:ABC transporter ATP-binding protein [Fontibacillus panacisegetis]SDF71397.1 ATP-binding cassette, subfamily B [Fontibacillus panacisegetis]